MKLSTVSYVLGMMLGWVAAGGWGLGHASRWDYIGPVFAVILGTVLSVLGLALHIVNEDEDK